jgi:predicted ATPase/DNA-binding CsgD family transcriptional regulator
MMSNAAGDPAEPLIEPLTRRERDVLALLAEGLTAPEIAERLVLGLSTVKYHIQNVYSKLGVNRKRQALVHARALGLLPVRPTYAPPANTEAEPPAPKHNLPLHVTRLFGREAETEQLKTRLAEHRLVTLTGPGGVGKTRLSLHAAANVLDSFRDGVWFADLAPLSDPELVAQQVAASVGLRDEPGLTILDTLSHFLRARQALLVLDNCEHLLEACAQLADGLLRQCPSVTIMASSREPLRLAGEAVFVVPSLPFPVTTSTPDAGSLAGYASVSLFVDRARLVLPEYDVTPTNAAAVARVCQRLDGIPLAIEMAAAWVSLLTGEQLADRLDDDFRVLVGGSRTALPRHKTLRATIDWSYALLTDTERLLLHRLSVFAGGCTLEAAEAVCSSEDLEPGAVVSILSALAAKSIVVADRRQGEPARYRLLETVRQYAREKLDGAGDGTRLRRRHRDYYLSLAETNFPKLRTNERAAWTPKLLVEQDNFRQPLEWSLSDLSSLEAGLRLLLAMGGIGFRHQEGLDWRIRALALCQNRPDISAHLHVKLLEEGSRFMALNDPQAAQGWAQQAVEISRGFGPEDSLTLMWSLLNLSGRFVDAGEADQAVAPLAETGAILGVLGPDRYASAEVMQVRSAFAYCNALAANQQGRYLDAKAHAAEHIRLGDALGSHFLVVNGQTNLGEACLHLGQYHEARVHFLAAIAPIAEVEGGVEVWPHGYMWLGLVDFRLGNLDRAREYCLESIRQADEIPDRNIIASDLGVMAAISAMQGHSDRAARLAGASAAVWARQKRKPWEFSSPDTLLPGWRDGPDAVAIQQAYDAGQAMTSDEAVAYALAVQAA